MPRVRSIGAVLLALAAPLLAVPLAAPTRSEAKDASRPAAKAPPDKAFQKVKREYQVKARNKKPAERIAALKLLEDFPTGDAADLVYVTLLDDKTDEVRRAAIDFLAALRDKSDVTDKVLARMTTTSHKDGMDIRAVGALEAFSVTEDEALQEQIVKYLDGVLGTPQGNQALLHGMIDERAAKGEAEEVLRMLMLFTRAQFFDQNFGYRRCLVQGLMQVRHQDGLTHLIDLLPRLKGLVQFDVVSHLVTSTGQNFGDDAAKWRAWWAENRGLKKAPDKSPPPPVGNYGNFGEYYGIPICAKRVVFVLDTSLSMRGARIEAAKTQLIRAINELHKEVFFDVIAFDNTPRVWRPELVPADDVMKRMAVSAVLEQPLKFKTASYDALEAAFGLDPEAIYFLSDGAPFGGKIDDPNEIIATVSAVNRVRRISIHSIGIDTGNPRTSVFGKFMKGLAEANWGVFKAVN
ncbi:MAG: VWA domain-containing protein [Deltaproteobacteria bacterium]